MIKKIYVRLKLSLSLSKELKRRQIQGKLSQSKTQLRNHVIDLKRVSFLFKETFLNSVFFLLSNFNRLLLLVKRDCSFFSTQSPNQRHFFVYQIRSNFLLSFPSIKSVYRSHINFLLLVPFRFIQRWLQKDIQLLLS